jgi:hypothetical protein
MSPGKIIGYIAAAILIFFGVLFIWGAFSANGQPGWIPIGVVTVLIGFGIIWLASRSKPSQAGSTTTLQIDLPANVNLDSLKCQSCGGVLKTEQWWLEHQLSHVLIVKRHTNLPKNLSGRENHYEKKGVIPWFIHSFDHSHWGICSILLFPNTPENSGCVLE